MKEIRNVFMKLSVCILGVFVLIGCYNFVTGAMDKSIDLKYNESLVSSGDEAIIMEISEKEQRSSGLLGIVVRNIITIKDSNDNTYREEVSSYKYNSTGIGDSIEVYAKKSEQGNITSIRLKRE